MVFSNDPESDSQGSATPPTTKNTTPLPATVADAVLEHTSDAHSSPKNTQSCLTTSSDGSGSDDGFPFPRQQTPAHVFEADSVAAIGKLITDSLLADVNDTSRTRAAPASIESFISNPYSLGSEPFRDTIVLRGGFATPERTPLLCEDDFSAPSWPPPSNGQYDIRLDYVHSGSALGRARSGTTYEKFEGAVPTAGDRFMELDGAGSESENSEDNTPNEPKLGKDGMTPLVPVSEAKSRAKSIKWNRPAWVSEVPGVSGPFIDGDDLKEEHMTETLASRQLLSWCPSCSTHHITPGGPLTLSDRDTCQAHLPRGFPPETHPAGLSAWDTWTTTLNEYAYLEELQRRRRTPKQHIWDLQWHERSAAWDALGRPPGDAHGGGHWARCRSSADAPPAERTCRTCHRYQTAVEQSERRAAQRRMVREAQPTRRMGQIEQFLESRIEDAGRADRAWVEAEMERVGWPAVLGAATRSWDVPVNVNVNVPALALGARRVGLRHGRSVSGGSEGSRFSSMAASFREAGETRGARGVAE